MKREMSLNGVWKFAPELEYRPTNNHNLMRTNIPLYAMPVLNRKDWEFARVPGVWERISEKYSIYEGVCWYCRTFNVSGIKEDTVSILRFGAVAYRADVFVNGKAVGVHESGYTEFTMDITEYMEEGENFIAVMVDNRAMATKWPNDRGYFGYGGIHRDVTLEMYDGTYIEDVNATPVWKDGGVLSVTGILHGESRDVTVMLGDETRTVTVNVDADGRFETVLTYETVKAWTPENPVLYPVVVTYDGNEYASWEIGFKSLTRENGKLYLNGEPFHVNGACYVYDSPTEGLVMTEEQLRFDLSEMKEANVNFIRTHYPMDEKFYALCDKMGFLVWIETNVYCTKPSMEETNTPYARPDYVAVAETMEIEMIAAARRHACIGIYGIGNECNVEHPEAKVFFPKMAALVRKLDNTRLVGYAALGVLVGDMGEIVDILGTNGYYGWYTKVSDLYDFKLKEEKDGKVDVELADVESVHAVLKIIEEKVPADLPLLLTEFGADSVPGYHSSALDLWSEEYHEKVIEEMIRASKKHDRIVGTFVFAFVDYMDPCKPLNGWWKDCNFKGMLTYNRNRRRPFYAMQKAYEK